MKAKKVVETEVEIQNTAAEASLKEVIARTEKPIFSQTEAQKFVSYKNEIERIEKLKAKLSKDLLPIISKMDTKKVPVDIDCLPDMEPNESNGFLQAIIPSPKKVFNLSEAKLSLPEATVCKIEPFIKTTASFDFDKVKANLGAALMKKLEPFLSLDTAFDLKAAEKALDEKTLKKLDAYCDSKEVAPYLKVANPTKADRSEGE